ncbi:universal stress protein [Ulvibacter litoralis]|uniref:Nucleotide-binding universal stress protein, UspA family n=1 Tax=Ulvibacter litoralis TaxID=227084 RepID=A0A1G7I9E9_9FLAO|nr:universal stress protein [Ulvibacter litoralis]GHC62065.1 universal stress protein UspA [Ulvibacter litoralis]SDF09351.1 Nucleotide-binding universal stress protein, UspA family [Ulvibacter litoralis]
MQQLLLPTDFSENAWNATKYALRFFEKKKVTFHFLHIDISLPSVKEEDLHVAGFSIKKEIPKHLKDQMEQWIQRIKSNYPNENHSFEYLISQTTFISGIRDYILKKDIDFIIMGTKGASGVKEMTLGSKTGAVITRVKCSILVIPEEASFKYPINIGFPTDFNMSYKQKVIDTLYEVTKMFQSSIKVLRVAQTQKPLDNFQNTKREELKERLSDIPLSFHVIEDPNLDNALQSFVTTMQIDMVAMIAKNLNFFQRILFKPQVAKISYHVQIPFLVLHE